MKKSTILFLLVTALCITLLPTLAFADMGPKPSVTIKFDESYTDFYVTLIAPEDCLWGPWQPVKDWDRETWDYNEQYTPDFDVLKKFSEYVDTNGYLFVGEFAQVDDGTFKWGYHPPEKFKILTYFPDTDSFAVSESIEQYAFNSGFIAQIDRANGTLKAERHYNYWGEIFSFFCRLLFTLAVEIGVAFVFKYRERDQFTLICFVNGLTQVALNVVLSIVLYTSGYLAFIITYFLAEIVVFIVEAIVYAVALNKIGTKRPVWKHLLYAFLANLLSFALGMGLSAILSLIPNIVIF